MTKQIKIDVLDVGFHLWTDDEKQHGYTNLTDLLDGLRGLLSDVPVEADEGYPWNAWDARSGLTTPFGLKNDDYVDYSCEDEPDNVYSARVRELTWTRVGGSTITRYRVVRS